jgi:hypothetical protein
LALLIPPLWRPGAWLTSRFTEFEDGQRLFRPSFVTAVFSSLINFLQNLLKWTFVRTRLLVKYLG